MTSDELARLLFEDYPFATFVVVTLLAVSWACLFMPKGNGTEGDESDE